MKARMVHPSDGRGLMTVDEFLMYELYEGSDERTQVELVRGELRVTPLPGPRHAFICVNLLARLIPHVTAHGLGRVFADGIGFRLLELPDTVRGPDVSFVRAGRVPAAIPSRGFLEMAPDLAVEVLSPSETASRLEEKLDDYRAAGTPLIWVIDPDRRTIMVISAAAPVRWLRDDDVLDGEAVVPGFQCRVAELFEGLDPA
jgi:Uma2 family endonuclease